MLGCSRSWLWHAESSIFVAARGIFSCNMWTLGCSTWDLVPSWAVNPRECRVLASEPPEKSHVTSFFPSPVSWVRPRFSKTLCQSLGLPRWLISKESTWQWRRLRRHRFDPWDGKISQRRKWQPSILAWKTHDREAWGVTVHKVAKSQTQLSDWTHCQPWSYSLCETYPLLILKIACTQVRFMRLHTVSKGFKILSMARRYNIMTVLLKVLLSFQIRRIC